MWGMVWVPNQFMLATKRQNYNENGEGETQVDFLVERNIHITLRGF